MAQRNYKAEYRRRIRRGLARGFSRSQACGHPKPGEKPIEAAPLEADPGINAAISGMNHGKSLSAAARSSHVSVERLRRFLVRKKLGERQGHRWFINDFRPRRVPIITGGRIQTLFVAGFDQSKLVGEHHRAVGNFVRTNDFELIKPFESQYIKTAGGKKYLLETDPNVLHRIASMDMPAFHEIYEIVAST